MRWRHKFATGDLELDLTSQRGDLSDGQASVVVGRDVLNRNRLAKAPGRKPVAISTGIPAEDQPLTTAIESDFHGRMITFRDFASGQRQSGEYLWQYIKFMPQGSSHSSNYPPDNALFELTDAGEERWGPFTADMLNQHAEWLPFSYVRPKRIGLVIESGPFFGNSAIILNRNQWSFDLDGDWRPETMLSVGEFTTGIYNAGFLLKIKVDNFHDKRGIWVSNGQKFWLLQGGVYILYLDLGDDSQTKGLTWRGTQISPWVFMFTNPAHPPRVISLEAPPNPGTGEIELSRSLAGMLPPDTAFVNERGGIIFKALREGGSGQPTADETFSSSLTGIDTRSTPESGGAKYRVRVRVVDDRTGAASTFVDAYKSIENREVDFDEDAISTGDKFFIFVDQNSNQTEDEPYSPLKTARATHIEFWRTRSDGVVFFLELRKALAWPTSGDMWTRYNATTNPDSGRDYSTSIEEGFNAHFAGRNAALGMSDTELLTAVRKDGSQPLQLNDTLGRIGGLPPVCVDIASVDGATIAGGEGDKLVIRVQKKVIEWPRVQSGQIIQYSELNTLIPVTESFHPLDFRRLSRSTDTFQRFAIASDVIVAVMRRGAHRIERVGPFLSVRQLAASGVGTPWPDTVLSVGARAAWVTPTGIRVYDADADEGRGQLSLLKSEGMEAWLAEALKFDMELDAGYDQSRGTIHIRRHITLTADQPTIPVSRRGSGGRNDEGVGTPFSSTTGKFLVDSAVVSLSTGTWTLIEDDTGFRYVNATHVEETPRASPSLYSVDETGGVFQESYEGDSHPYDSLTVQGDIGGTYTMPTRGRLLGPGGSFSSIMTGDVIRFWGAKLERGGRARRITVANESCLEFDELPVPTNAERFVIGASRFRIRWAPFQGTSPQTDKTLESLAIVALSGRRHSVNGLWPDPPDKKLTVRIFRNLSDFELDSDVAGVPIFDDQHAEFRTVDRHSDVEADGNQLEIEIEQLDARTDVILSSVEARIREDGTENEDASTET